jgi:A/G-specific adenine glycosylase
MTPPDRRHRPATWRVISPSLRSFIKRRLLRWYDRNQRDLPWRRRGGDPYAQWVAEIMLQQTRVETVLDYYERFLARFPGVETLARADHEKVLKHWEGLGYYRRALHLHQAARIVRDVGDGVPTTAEELRRLPGIGDYTAAAVASIAFNERVAAVDGNVARVMARLFGVGDDILSAKGKQRVRYAAAQLMPLKRCGDFNQAWMDLGSMVCTPRSPRCGQCPLVSRCMAAANEQPHVLPLRGTNRTKRREILLLTAIFLHDGKMLVHRRPRGGLWSGLWEFPTTEILAPRSAKSKGCAGSSPRGDAARRLVGHLADGEGVEIVGEARPVLTIRHQLSHRSFVFHVYVVPASSQKKAGVKARNPRWVTPRVFARLSVSTAHRRIYAGARAAIQPVK